MPNLADSLMRRKFVEKLEQCERKTLKNDWEERFVNDMRERFEAREDMIDLGVSPWNPSANQWNTLSLIAEKYT